MLLKFTFHGTEIDFKQLFNMSRLKQVNGQYAKTLSKAYKFEGKIAYLCKHSFIFEFMNPKNSLDANRIDVSWY